MSRPNGSSSLSRYCLGFLTGVSTSDSEPESQVVLAHFSYLLSRILQPTSRAADANWAMSTPWGIRTLIDITQVGSGRREPTHTLAGRGLAAVPCAKSTSYDTTVTRIQRQWPTEYTAFIRSIPVKTFAATKGGLPRLPPRADGAVSVDHDSSLVDGSNKYEVTLSLRQYATLGRYFGLCLVAGWEMPQFHPILASFIKGLSSTSEVCIALLDYETTLLPEDVYDIVTSALRDKTSSSCIIEKMRTHFSLTILHDESTFNDFLKRLEQVMAANSGVVAKVYAAGQDLELPLNNYFDDLPWYGVIDRLLSRWAIGAAVCGDHYLLRQFASAMYGTQWVPLRLGQHFD
ncbi:hypothetical protein BCR44DRAFT_47321 [Catenaria anguillulae PL171]|uniref:Uncharacterized protein n=1 Tax=Catenaria anguillulae PL171 TaxID=765915 RepID=A0A1Y2HSG0_9FUNG|nr:hypothetical protein BCR44DRAFT_47321 [Catenaria anguillulae PL171]